jgi:outer membrane protein OmpA-like peptidoglycan-associated protein
MIKFLLPIFIFSFSLFANATFAAKKSDAGVMLHGKVLDAQTFQYVSGTVSVYFDTDILKSRSDLENGEFSEKLTEVGWYIITISAKGYNETSDTLWVLSDFRKEVSKNFMMTSKEASAITAKNVYFDLNKIGLTAEANNELDKVVKFLEENAGMSCKLGGHADRSGTSQYNLEISEKRSLAVADYLVSRGIDRARLKVIAFGALSPLNASKTYHDHAKNRRVEIIPYLKKTQDDANVVFSNLLFDYGKYSLSEQADIELEDIAMFLKDNPRTSCEIAGHTDGRGSAQVNQILSKERAQIVMNYLIGKGIESSRLSVRGHGDTRPVASNDTNSGRAKNRRVEFNILD